MQVSSEIIIVRSLTESDLGLFAVHRRAGRSKQRAININSAIARRLLTPALYKCGKVKLNCICVFEDTVVREARQLGKTHKNWRLGGRKIKGETFARLDSKDFVLIRSVAGNDGSYPVTITFISRHTDRLLHAGLAAVVERRLADSMAVYEEGVDGFSSIADHCPAKRWEETPAQPPPPSGKTTQLRPLPPMPTEDSTARPRRSRTIREKLHSPHILERMLRVAGDLSASAQLRFMETVEQLASQLRCVLDETGGIVRIDRNHRELWASVSGRPIGFVDGGLANLSMLGSAPIAARVGGYTVIPGARGPDREKFIVLKHLIDELYAHDENAVYENTFPDIGALRDAARISIEAAGAVRLLADQDDLSWVFLHGALVNPVSRYTDIMKDRKVLQHFPDFSDSALTELLPPGEPPRQGRDRNFISVHRRQLEILSGAQAVVCGVIERESTTTSVCREVLNSLEDDRIRDFLPMPPAEWKRWFRAAVDPSDDDGFEGQRITDSLLFRCVLEPGEALRPVVIDRNDKRRAPDAWRDVIIRYPKPHVSYLQVTEWSAPVRLEMFEKDRERFRDTASLIMHCALLLPRYAFPVGLDIVDKFARIPNWMSRPVNTHTAVQAMKRALDQRDMRLFDALRRTLCGSGREFLLRPGIYR